MHRPIGKYPYPIGLLMDPSVTVIHIVQKSPHRCPLADSMLHAWSRARAIV